MNDMRIEPGMPAFRTTLTFRLCHYMAGECCTDVSESLSVFLDVFVSLWILVCACMRMSYFPFCFTVMTGWAGGA